jgi:hypothetical protein
MAKAEGWIDKNGSKWKTMPEQMLMYRAATFFCRVFCPEVLAGVQTSDEITDIGYTEMPSNNSAIDKINNVVAPEPIVYETFEDVPTVTPEPVPTVTPEPVTSQASVIEEEDDF